jgi:hypothetical protein
MKANDFAHFVPAVLKQDPGAPSYGTSMVAVAQGKHRVPTGGSPMRELNWGPECFIVEQYKIEPVQTGEKDRVGDINHLSTMVTYGNHPKPQVFPNAPRNGVGSKRAFHGMGLFRMRVGVQSYQDTLWRYVS